MKYLFFMMNICLCTLTLAQYSLDRVTDPEDYNSTVSVGFKGSFIEYNYIVDKKQGSVILYKLAFCLLYYFLNFLRLFNVVEFLADL